MEPAPSSVAIILSRYAVCDEIASGGMATVHVGRQRGAAGFARTVAVKRLFPTYARDPEFVAMFTDEARLAARVRHPNVIATLDVVAENQELFLVMEYVAGEALSTLVRGTEERGERVPPTVAASIVLGMLEGLHAVHEAVAEDGRPLGIVHRDVSPHNVLVGVDGSARLLDFGIAKATALAQRTQQGLVKGKLAYMAPEQLRGEPVTRASDLFSVGVVLWELLTGRRLFRAASEGAIVAKILEARVPRVEELAPAIPPDLGGLVAWALAKQPSDRPRSAAEMARHLERALAPASHHTVGAWVREVAGPSLDARAAIVRRVEQEAGDVEPSATTSGVRGTPRVVAQKATEPHPAQLRAPGSRRSQHRTLTMAAPTRSGWTKWAIAGGVVVAAVALLAGLVLARTRPPADTAARGVAASAQGAAIRARPSIPEAASPPATPPREAAPDAPIAEAAPTAAPLPPSHASPTAIAAPKAKSPCDPPYYVDEDGIRRVKRECLW